MSFKVKVYNQNAEETGEMELSPKVFGVKKNTSLVHQAVVTQMANQRKVIAHTKIRSEVRGGGKKPWAQKGTGRARHGSSRSPIWKGGGVTFGPRNDRNFKMRINKKMRQNAILMVLSDKVANSYFTVLDKLETNEFKTKILNNIVEKLGKIIKPASTSAETKPSKKAALEKRENLSAPSGEKALKQKPGKRNMLIIVEKADDKLNYSARNLVGVKMMHLDNINILDLLKYKNLIVTQAVVKKLEERYK